MERTKFTWSSSGKAFEKQAKANEDENKKQIKGIEDNGKQLVESDEIVRKDFNIDRYNISLEEQKKYLMYLLKRDLLNV